MAGEYPAKTNYLYLTYNGDDDEMDVEGRSSVIVLGSGVYRIGSSVEFDWCCVNAVKTVRRQGLKAIVLNYNPETVSTDYDEADYLVFDEVSVENILGISRRAQPKGVIVSMGGQTANNLALSLHESHVKVLGTHPEQIDRAENRHKFSMMLDELGVDQPKWSELNTYEEIRAFAEKVTYPVIVRPSYVLSGAAMGVATNPRELSTYLEKATVLSPENPVVVSKFEENAKEIELDAVASDGEILRYAISEHVENAGVHSGDATLVLPPQRTYLETMRRIRLVGAKIAKALAITGPFNIQFIAKENAVKVIECNLRSSRSFPFVSKVTGRNFVETATEAILGLPVREKQNDFTHIDFVGVKASQFSFARLNGADPTLGVEMSSTGEVGCLGDDFNEALLKAMLSVGYKVPLRHVLISSGPPERKADFLDSMAILRDMGVRVYATQGTHAFFKQHGFETDFVHWPDEESQPNVVDLIKNGSLDLVVNIPKNFMESELNNDYLIRRRAVDHAVPLITNTQLALRMIEACGRCGGGDLKIRHWAEYVNH